MDNNLSVPSAFPYPVSNLPCFFIYNGFLRIPRDYPLAFRNLNFFLVFVGGLGRFVLEKSALHQILARSALKTLAQ